MTTDSSALKPRIFTTFGTVLYVEADSAELRHGPVDNSPANVVFVVEGQRGQIAYDAAGSRRPIAYQAERSLVAGSSEPVTSAFLDIKPIEAGWFALQAGNVFLCAEPDGRVTLSRSERGSWERFKLSAPPLKLMSHFVYADILQKLWRGCDPYYGFPYKTVKPDLQGWGSQHRYLGDTVAARQPNIIVEIGVWKGASCLELARAVQTSGLDSAVIAIDTWLGSFEHWINDHWFGDLGFEFGYPTIYRTFLTNMILGGVKDIVVPLPIDSTNAWHVFKHYRITPELVHIDGGHDFDAVRADLAKWWEILSPGGTIIVDDYDDKGQNWHEVREATDAFLKEVEFTDFEAANHKCRFVKRIAEAATGTKDNGMLVPE